jgi:hypothetical protein
MGAFAAAAAERPGMADVNASAHANAASTPMNARLFATLEEAYHASRW